jgi:predicted dehydrogenase
MTADRWQRFCVVGVGHHARTKLIPAIQANGQTLVGIVSRRAAAEMGAPRFASVAEAVAALPSDTAFIIASPPTVHYAQAMRALEAGRDVVIEKPAFVTTAEADRAVRVAESSGALVVEGFMNRQTATHRLFLDEWSAGPLQAIECSFTLPSVPEGTFRSDMDLGASSLYDVASYVLSALIDAGADLDRVQLDRVDYAGLPDKERLHLSGKVNEANFSSVTGVAACYENVMRLIRADGTEVAFTPFVYGRPGPRRIWRRQDGKESETAIEDVNAFETMLAKPLQEWRETAVARGRSMIQLTRHLERLGGALADFRAAAGCSEKASVPQGFRGD